MIAEEQTASTRDKTHALWQRYMKCYDFLQCVDTYRQNTDDVVNALALTPRCRVLDAGSGTGNLSLKIKALGASVVSMDFSECALRQHILKDPQACTVHASLESRLPFANESFDRVCCASVLFTLSKEGSQLAVREFHRILTPNGRLAVTVASPSKRDTGIINMHWQGLVKRRGRLSGSLQCIRDLPALAQIVHYNRLLRKLPDWNGYHRFDQQELQQLLSNAGFSDVNISRTFGDCFFIATAVSKNGELKTCT